MFDKIKELKNQGMSIAKIADTLNQQGVKTAQGRNWAEHSVAYQLKKGTTPMSTKKFKKKGRGNAANGAATSASAVAAHALGRKVAARKDASTFANTLGKTQSFGRKIDLTLSILTASELDPQSRIEIAKNILGA